MSRLALDQAQQSAVDHLDGPCLVLAGPGSGKTRVIVERFVSLLERGISPRELLVLTYTNKAASEMRERVEAIRGDLIEEAPLSTYHSFAGRLLRDWGWLIGISPSFRIADDAQRWLQLESVLAQQQPRLLWNPLRPNDIIDPLLRLFETAKQELVMPQRYAQWAADRRAHVQDADELLLLDRHDECAAVYSALQEHHKRSAVLDHDDTILYAEQLLREHAAVRRAVAEPLHYVMVDEFQDTNFAQARLVETLVEHNHNILVVADDDQAIYKFRGASLANLERFQHTYADHAKIVLGTNYRSTPQIVAMSRAVIAETSSGQRFVKEISAHREPGADVETWDTPDSQTEAHVIAQECARLITAGTSPNDIALLFRRHADMQPAMAAFESLGIPFVVFGGRGYFQLPEIKDLLALLSAVADIRDSQALLRCLLMPRWMVSARGRVALVDACNEHDQPLVDLIREPRSIPGLEGADMEAVQQCIDSLFDLHARAGRDDVRDLFYDCLDASGYLGVVDESDPVRRRQMAASLNKFGELLESFADWSPDRRVSTALTYILALRDCGAADDIPTIDSDSNGVAMLTAHSAKGLEWPVVFLCTCIEKRWPGRPGFGTKLALPDELVPEPPPDGDSHIDEERRLFYVAATRARDRLIFSMAQRYPQTFKNEIERPTPFLAPAHEAGYLVQRSFESSVAPLRRKARPAQRDPGERLRISVSDLAAFATCPRQFEYRRRFHLPVRPTVYGWYGSLVHSVLQTAGAALSVHTPMSVEQILELWFDTWERATGPKGLRPDLREVGADQLRRYCTSDAWLTTNVASVESSFTLQTTSADVIGRFDRIDMRQGAPTVVDYKTGPPRDAEALARDLQVRAYAVAAARIHGVDDIGVELHYLQTGEVVRVEFDSRKLDNAFKNVSAQSADVLRAWRSGEFTPKASAWTCQRCDYRTVCDEGKAATSQPLASGLPSPAASAH